jgi:hypothetical protein
MNAYRVTLDGLKKAFGFYLLLQFDCAGFCAVVAEMCRFLAVPRSRFALFVRFVHIEKVNIRSYLPNRWGIVQR